MDYFFRFRNILLEFTSLETLTDIINIRSTKLKIPREIQSRVRESACEFSAIFRRAAALETNS